MNALRTMISDKKEDLEPLVIMKNYCDMII